MKPFIPILLTVLTLTLFGAKAEEKDSWERVKETKDGIVIYMRAVPGTSVKEIRVNLQINIPPRLVLDAACDPKSYKKAVKYVEQNDYYWTENPDLWFTYQLVNFPIIDKRDYVMRYERTLNPEKGIYRLSWETTNKTGPGPKEDVIRVQLATGKIDVIPLEGGKKSLMKYRLLADPGGNIPGWVMNLANKMNMPDIIREIRNSAISRAKKCVAGDCQLWDAVGDN